jgi:Domain of unknown function (DUF1874)
MRYVFNSAIIGRPGHYEYKLLTELEGEAWLREGRFVSRVGNLQTTKFIEDRFGVHCPQSREPISMVAGDEGLVVRLVYRPLAAGHVEPRTYGWEIGLLKRTA